MSTARHCTPPPHSLHVAPNGRGPCLARQEADGARAAPRPGLCRCRGVRPVQVRHCRRARARISPHSGHPASPCRLHVCTSTRSAYDGVVPARGKALLKTDLAIAVPHGTYGRVGESNARCAPTTHRAASSRHVPLVQLLGLDSRGRTASTSARASLVRRACARARTHGSVRVPQAHAPAPPPPRRRGLPGQRGRHPLQPLRR